MKLDEQLELGSAAFVDWFKRDALPLWSSQGLDPECGASYERFLANGEVDYEINPRVRVQARQIFTFCKAQDLGWMSDARPVVEKIIAFSQQRGMLEGSDYYGHLWSPSYELIESQVDLYNHAFWILSCAARIKSFNDNQARQYAERLLQKLDTDFGSVAGGWLEGNYPAPCRRQNPHMHLFEATMSMYEATNDARWLARAGELFCLFEARFFDGKFNVLREFFDADWQVLRDAKGNVIEPGHMMEWVWLLRWYEKLSGHNVDAYANSLFDVSVSIGLNDAGLVYDGVSPEGEVLQATKRSWPLIELVKAAVVQARVGVAGAEALAGRSLQLLLERYIGQASRAGLYVDQLDESDEVCSGVAPASTLYHLIVAAEEVANYVRDCKK